MMTSHDSRAPDAMARSHELLLLGLLDRRRMHGYELHEFLERRLGFVSDLKKPTAYRLLERLHERGLVERDVERAGRRPERLVYRLTAAGRARLGELLREQLARAPRVPNPGDVALLFCGYLPAAERLALLEQRRAALAKWRTSLAAAVPIHAPDPGAQLVLDRHLKLVEAELAWLDRVIGSLARQP